VHQVRRRPIGRAIGFYPVSRSPGSMGPDAASADRMRLEGNWKQQLRKVMFGLESDFELL